MHSYTILVVDDEPLIRSMLQRLFQRKGYDVHEAADGTEALHLAQQTRFDAIIIDVGLPGLQGDEVVQELRKHQGYQATPIFIMSGSYSELAHLSYDATYHLPKPMMLNQLLTMVVQACGTSALSMDP